MRPATVALVVGTATEVGKTHVCVEVITHLRARSAPASPTRTDASTGEVSLPLALAARKPVESYEPEGGPTDAERLAGATGEPVHVVCDPERSYPLPMAPPMAADALGRPAPTVADLAGWLHGSWPTPALDLALVECAGGVASPQAVDGDCRDLARLVEPDVVVLVADAGLGAVNAVRLSVEVMPGWPVVVFLNRHDPADDVHVRNLEWLRGCLAVPVITAIAALADLLLEGR